MKRLLVIVLALVMVAIGVSACSGSSGAVVATAGTTTTSVTIPDGTQFGFVRQVTAGTLTFDPAEFLGGDEALEAARADGAIGPAEDLSDPFYIRNPIEEEVLLEVDPTAQFTLLVAPENSDLVQKTVSMDELARLSAGGAQDPHAPYYAGFTNGLPMNLTISAGRVTGGVEQYVP